MFGCSVIHRTTAGHHTSLHSGRNFFGCAGEQRSSQPQCNDNGLELTGNVRRGTPMRCCCFCTGSCGDVAPSQDFTCAQQVGFGKCNEGFMKGYCNLSCGRCGATGRLVFASLTTMHGM